MRKVFLAVSACTLLTAAAWSQSKPSQVGTWKVDMSQSDFGADPAPKSVTLTILKDSPKMLSWRLHEVDSKGKPGTFSWSGPQDGSMHPVMQNGKAIGKESAKQEEGGVLLRHGEDPDGSSFDARSTVSEDGKTITDELTSKSKDGKESKQKMVYHRTSGTAMAQKKAGD